ncbi:Y-family DNA polymerase [Spirosoma linguale]|uniref:DNA-directed DNA polymerase n=1 Tax=Spirosoma linguale (strain ATCC 33905 / DSM 74 / LMG 10896 / Claus 1) TaxID=504472 RepID=D2QVG5_SPILD|nr:DNA-directed DNA polymerase [Spirosoma linguale DSM 74]
MIALADCNNFYVSCERSFNPSLNGQPVVVLSNNDGSIVARSNEVKKLNVGMGQPFFEIERLRQEHGIHVFSSNYVLYGSMSARVMAIFGRFVEDVEVYSIDEAFFDLNGYESIYPDLTTFAHNLRSTVMQWTRIPISIGIAPTKTLAKVANWYAKRQPDASGVCMLSTPEQIRQALEQLSVDELWGIGRRYASFLKQNGIKTALEFSQCHDVWVQKHFTINGLRLVYELRGEVCRTVETQPSARKSVCVAPSFGELVGDRPTLYEALTNYVARASEKLRKQRLAAGAMTVFLHTNRFRAAVGQYSNSRSFTLPVPTNLIPELSHYAIKALDSIYKSGYAYQKVGLILSALQPDTHQTPDVFEGELDPRLLKLLPTVERLNSKLGRDKVRFAAQGFNHLWKMKQRWLSPCYTTHWKDIIITKN